jgi:hypothetical protein
MYSEPESCYLEYAHNAVDSIDTALAEILMQAQDFRIEIIVDGSKQGISIKDNGTGIKKDLVRKTLLHISPLLDLNEVRDNISQVAPIPFSGLFYWGREIKTKLAEDGIDIAEYPVLIGESFELLSQVYKPYKVTFEANSRACVSKDGHNEQQIAKERRGESLWH